ncbi:hydrogenase expression/formation protein [Methanohalophilus euhalobius]|uniref:Hydrogenase expression/formation protein n=1 Tax=Methanohalophilus euhalobius TaxID=51203 RepID=A0A285FAF4_9EURY|nr:MULTISPECIES: AIR synthase-related protein [Methanohalophilus]ODV50144.1 MAG: hydrogenase expression/formation protein [Methanohalophilus sp. 2-GBenrich]RSD35192.1 MAG: hydrogenase expression/formation protein [Methanohalophilus sp.]TCL12171.1 hydrogenase expression/formation protein [Methanohalophilus euhalobius]SNY08269.1 hydrogenase expression/formation protein [Methanohalophilus euhalobius]
MDIEGYARHALLRGEDGIAEKLAERIMEIKDTDRQHAIALAKAAIEEARATLDVKGDVLSPITSGVTMGQFGVGSRGTGDFYAHEKIAEVIGSTKAAVDSTHLDDSGAVQMEGGDFLIVTIDGIHSRLSDFPFLAGFHVARASLRDVYVMGSRPLALLSDIHVADDGDVAKIFDHVAGITAVSELTDIPLVTGSTLRIGGDMVIGDRMTGGVGAVGVASAMTARERADIGDVILMTEGAGGGTISTTALYYGMHDVVDETINIKFLQACEALLEKDLDKKVHAMTDVTNGGVRGDAKEISRTAGVKLVFEEENMRGLVNPRVLGMLESLNIDYLGVSLDSLLLIVPPEHEQEILETVQNAGVDIATVGYVEKGQGAELVIDGQRRDFTPRFRESAYTPIKKMVGDTTPDDFEAMCKAIDRAAEEAISKKRHIVEMLGKQ